MNPKLQRRVQRYGWDKAAAYYEEFWAAQLRPSVDRLLELAALKPGERVLDVACGTGLVTFRAAKELLPGGEIVGNDISSEMINAAERIGSEKGVTNAAFERIDAESEQNSDTKEFNAALCSLGLMYFPDPAAALCRMRDALRKGGRVVASVWGQRERCGWAEIFPIVDSRVESDVCPMFFRLGTQDLLARTLTEAGFVDVELERIYTVLDYANGDDACGAAFAGGPVALAYARFDDKEKLEAQAEYLDSIEQFRSGDGYQIPGEFVIARGVKAE